MLKIDYTYLSNTTKRFETEADTIIIGRPSRDWVVDLDLSPDGTVSRRHARLSFEDNTVWIEDINSLGGTWVNGQKIAGKTAITANDKIKIGQTELTIQVYSDSQIDDDSPLQIDLIEDETQPLRVDEKDDPFESGSLTNKIRATETPSSLLVGEEPDAKPLEEAVSYRLTAFYDLGAALSTVESVEALLNTVIEHLCKVIPGAQRGAILLRDGRKLRPKAQLPEKASLSISLHLARLTLETQEALIWRRGAPEEDVPLTHSMISHGIRCAMYAPLIWQKEILGIVYVDNYIIENAFNDDDLRLLMAMAGQAAMFVKNHALQEDLRHQEVVRSNLMRQFSPQVAEHLQGLLREKSHLGLGGEHVEPVTILNADVRGFTALSSQMEPGSVMEMLNQLFGASIPVIFKYNGTVDKYIGDGFLAVFGSPNPDPKGQQWENAVRAALEIQSAVRKLGREWQSLERPAYKIGIGIHTGPVLQGFIGSDEQMEYTVIGDTVNRASRYCDGAGPGEVVISPSVYKRVTNLVEVTAKSIKSKHAATEGELDAYVVKGFSTKILGKL